MRAPAPGAAPPDAGAGQVGDANPRSRPLVTAGRRAGGAVVSQFVTAGGSLVLQVIAARSLGAAGYGAYAIFLAVLVSLNAIQTGWVGDSLTVLDRFDDEVRGALFVSQVAAAALAFAASVTLALALGLTAAPGALLFASMVALWVLEELGRRLFIARQEFWHLAVNDACYVAVTLIALGVGSLLRSEVTLATFVGAMAVGTVGAISHAAWRLPAGELRVGRVSRRGLREVASFAAWRSAQAGLKPLVLLAVRVCVAALTSRAVLGSIEAARLLLAPATSLIAGVGSFLLSSYSADVRSGRSATLTRRVYAAMGALLGAVVLVGAGAMFFLSPATELLTSGRFTINGTVVLGWTAYAAAFAVGVPPAVALLARRSSRTVFLMRVLDASIGLTVALLVLAVDRPNLVPYALALGGAVAAVLLCRKMSAHREAVT